VPDNNKNPYSITIWIIIYSAHHADARLTVFRIFTFYKLFSAWCMA